MNDRRVLRRAQWWTVLLGVVVAAVLALGGRQQLAVGLGVGSLWAAANLRTLEGLMTAAVQPRDRPRHALRISIWFLLKLSVYVVAIWLLIVAPFPVAGMLHGLTVMLAALVLAGLVTRDSLVTKSGSHTETDHQEDSAR